MNINYTLRGSIEVPAGSSLTDTGTGIVLPDGTVLKLWEAWEHHTDDDEDPVDLTFDDVTGMGCHYDGAMAEFQITE